MAGNKSMNSREKLAESFRLLQGEKRDVLEEMFSKCPDYVVNAVEQMRISPKQTFINAGEKCMNIYILLKGKARALDYQTSGNLYAFKEFYPSDIMGDYECLGKVKDYVISISTVTTCEMLIIPTAVYLNWMREDNHALMKRMEQLMQALLLETKESRKYLFLNSRERLLLYLIEQFEEHEGIQILKIKKTQEEIAERLGVDKRTVQRSIKDLKDEDMISLESGKILISESHYFRMKEYEQDKLLSAE